MDSSGSDVIKTALFENLRKVISVIDELRDVGLQEHIRLPRIAVVGTQSSGKSSLLENVVGLDFLPRGSGVVTRRPLELRMVHISYTSGEVKPWAVFEEIKGEKFTDFDIVRQKIEELTDKVAGSTKGIVDKPIILTIYSNDCPDLTIIDLPGITRIAISGSDQEQVDIEKVTKDMVRRYIEDQRTVILAVMPANQDITTSDGLDLARKIDTKGERTIGVITKIDIMDKGTDAKSMLEGREVPLKLGYVGIRNRSQQDIIDKVKVKKAIELEQEFFLKHPVYQNMNPNVLGTQALIQKLTTVLYTHIRNCLPQITAEINNKIHDCEERLKDLGPTLPADAKEKMRLIYEMITHYADEFNNQILGKYDIRRGQTIKSEISGGALIKMMFADLYNNFINVKATKDISDEHIQIAIKLHQGDSLPGFPSIDAFLYLINPQLEQLQFPAQECLNEVYSYLEQLSTTIIQTRFARFPTLCEEINQLASKVLQQHRDRAQQVVDNIIDSEQSYLFTNDLEYLGHQTLLAPPDEKGGQNNVVTQQKDSNKIFIDELRSRVDVYYEIVIRNVRDSIPKAIGNFLVRASQDNLQYSIYNEIMQNEDLMTSLGEPANLAEQRETINRTLNTLKKAIKVLKRDPDLMSSGSNDDQNNNFKENQRTLKSTF